MFCPRCGTEVLDESRFCGSCGYELSVLTKERDVRSAVNVSAIISFWLMIMSSPVLLVLCLISQEEAVGFSWKLYTYTYVPENLQIVFVIVTLTMLISSIVLKISSKLHSKKFNIIYIIGYIVSVLACFLIMLSQFPL